MQVFLSDDSYQTMKNSNYEEIARRHGLDFLYSSDSNQKRARLNASERNQWLLSSIDHNHSAGQNLCYLCTIDSDVHEHTKPRDESKRRKLIPYVNPKARPFSAERVTQSNPSDLVPYRIIVRTGKGQNTGTRAHVFLYMYGTEKNWTCIPLRSKIKDDFDGFPAGSTRSFCLKGPEIGQLHHFNVNLVGNRSEKEWFLKEIEITQLNKGVTWLCEFNSWLPKNQPKDFVENTHQESIRPHSASKETTSVYVLKIRNGEKPFLGQISSLQLTIRGSDGHRCQLAFPDYYKNLFQTNQLDTFEIVCSNFGDPTEISIECDPRQIPSSWDIKEMSLWKLLPNQSKEPVQSYFSFNTALTKKTNAIKAKVELYPTKIDYNYGPVCYQIIIGVNKAFHRDTIHVLSLKIYGKSGRSVNHQLDAGSKVDFGRDKSMQFIIMDIDVGQIEGVKIWHEPSKPDMKPWPIESVTVVKRYSYGENVSEIFTERLEQIGSILYHQVHRHDQNLTRESDKTSSAMQRTTSRGSTESLGGSRGILRSPIGSERRRLQKNVTFDEQSLNSQEDLNVNEYQRSVSMTQLTNQKQKVEDRIYWISSHNYLDHQWFIQSVEEKSNLDLNPKLKARLLSDRPSTQTSRLQSSANKDEIYQFDIHQSFNKDPKSGHFQLMMTPIKSKSTSLSSHTAEINHRAGSQSSLADKMQTSTTGSGHSSTSPMKNPRLTRDRALSDMKNSPNETPQTHLQSLTKSSSDSFGRPKTATKRSEEIVNRSVRMESPRSPSTPDFQSYSQHQRNTSFDTSKDRPISSDQSRQSPSSLTSSQNRLTSSRQNQTRMNSTTGKEELLDRITNANSRSLTTKNSRSSSVFMDKTDASSSPRQLGSSRDLNVEPRFDSRSLPRSMDSSKVTVSTNSTVTDRDSPMKNASRESLNPSRLPKSQSASKKPSPISRDNENPHQIFKSHSSSSSIRSNPQLPRHKSIHEQVYQSAYGTIPSDDF